MSHQQKLPYILFVVILALIITYAIYYQLKFDTPQDISEIEASIPPNSTNLANNPKVEESSDKESDENFITHTVILMSEDAFCKDVRKELNYPNMDIAAIKAMYNVYIKLGGFSDEDYSFLYITLRDNGKNVDHAISKFRELLCEEEEWDRTVRPTLK